MVREDILGGLRTALARGQTLRQSMMSFYNAGYVKEEIEEAARAVQAEKNQPLQSQFTPGPTAPIFQRTSSIERDPDEKPKEVLSQTARLPQSAQTIQKVSAYGQQTQQPAQAPITQQPAQTPITPQPVQAKPVQQPAQTIQKVSAYAQPLPVQQPLVAKPRGKAIIFILIALLILLISGLIALFFFKDEILSFFNSV